MEISTRRKRAKAAQRAGMAEQIRKPENKHQSKQDSEALQKPVTTPSGLFLESTYPNAANCPRIAQRCYGPSNLWPKNHNQKQNRLPSRADSAVSGPLDTENAFLTCGGNNCSQLGRLGPIGPILPVKKVRELKGGRVTH